MNSILYLEIAIIPSAMLLVLCINSWLNSRRDKLNRLFRIIMLLTILALTLEAFCWVFDGTKDAQMLLWVGNTANYIVISCITFMWFCYAYMTLYGEAQLTRKVLLLGGIPFIISLIFYLLTPLLKLAFYIDANGFYTRGPLFFIHMILTFTYPLITFVLAVRQYRFESTRDRRRECIAIALFLIMPMLGALIQGLLYGMSLIWQFTAISLLIIYVNISNKQISIDSLTGLNNRGQFDRYIAIKCTEHDKYKRLCLLLMDVDRFKSINDTYGHLAGDETLKLISRVLKRVFANSQAFLARFGGDEFAVILDVTDDAEIALLIKRIHEELETEVSAQIMQGSRSFDVTLSIGFAQLRAGAPGDVKKLIAAADSVMYEEKKREKQSNTRHGQISI